MNRSQAHAQISRELNSLLALATDAPPVDEESLLWRTWNFQVNRFFSVIRSFTWRQSANSIKNILQNNRSCLIVSQRLAFTARIVQIIPLLHPKAREWCIIHTLGPNGNEDDFLQPSPCVLLEITDVFFKSDDTNFLSRTLDNRPMSGLVVYDLDEGKWDFDLGNGWATEFDRFIVMAM